MEKQFSIYKRNMKNFHRYRNYQLMQISQNDELSQCSTYSCLLFSFKRFSRKLFFVHQKLLQNNYLLLLSLPTIFCFELTVKDKTELLILPENLGYKFCCCGCWGEQKFQIAYHLFSGQFTFGVMWVGCEELFCFHFKAFVTKTPDFEILFSCVLA